MTGIKHTFVSAIDDEDDTSLVRPSNWNDEHDTPATMKGDLLAAASGGSLGALHPTNDGEFLVLDSLEALGVKWTPGPSGLSAAIRVFAHTSFR